MTGPAAEPPCPLLSIPDIRDYERINAELLRCLEAGHPRVRLVGAEGQRFLALGLKGPWIATIEVEGKAGPELAAELDAPGITVVCRGPAGDGAGRGLRAGRLVILGDAHDGLAYAQEGGLVLAARSCGHRAGLNQRGGTLAILGPVGRLAGERQSGGWLFAYEDRLGPHAGYGRRGGRFVRLKTGEDAPETLDADDRELFYAVLHERTTWSAAATGSQETGR